MDCIRQQKNPKQIVHSWEWSTKPWDRIHIDFAGPFMNSMFMIVVDAHSKWLEAIQMNKIHANATIEELRPMFARYGLPRSVVTDNGTTFTSNEFRSFVQSNGIKHFRTAPYHPQSNGQAERCVQTIKDALRRMKNESGTLNQKLSRFLIQYRRSPHQTTGESPSMLFMKRSIRNLLNRSKPDIETDIKAKRGDQIGLYRRFNHRDKVAVRMFGTKKWEIGFVISQNSGQMYSVRVGNEVHRRHIDQMRDCGEEVPLDPSETQLPRINDNKLDPLEPKQNNDSQELETDKQFPQELINNEIGKENNVQNISKRKGRGPAKDYGPPTRRSQRIISQSNPPTVNPNQ